MNIPGRKSQSFSSNPDYDFEIRTVIGHSVAGAAEIGEVLAATSRVSARDHKGWFQAWNGLGTGVVKLADNALSAGNTFTAAQAYLRASVYLGVAVNAMSSIGDDGALLAVFRKHRQAWEAFTKLSTNPVQKVQIPYSPVDLPGYLFRPDPKIATGATLVAVNGSDGSISSLWASCAEPALARGYNVLLFDGPGQQSMLFEKSIPFRPDWENVLSPVYEYISKQDGVDPNQICLYGISQGGYWVTRALAFEHRYAAAVADPGVLNVSASWINQIPKPLVKLLDEGKTDKFDRNMTLGMKLTPATARSWRFRARPYGKEGYAETIEAVKAHTATDVAKQITTPLFITDPEGEPFWPGQSESLAALTRAVSTLVHFTNAQGAGGHCEPLARMRVSESAFDWMESQLAKKRHT